MPSYSRGSLRSSSRKTALNDENDPSTVKKSRTKKIYSFTPTTTSNFVKIPKLTPRKRGNPDQNSDDHVYWEMTPNSNGHDSRRKITNKKLVRNIPSSPIVENKTGGDLDPLAPFLRKYNTTLDNLISQTPKSLKQVANRRSSDPEISENSKAAEQLSPLLNRTKSAGLALLETNKAVFNPMAPAIANSTPLTHQFTSTPANKDRQMYSPHYRVSSGSNINKLLEAIGNSFNPTTPLDSKLAQQNQVLTDHDSNDFDDDISSDLGNISMLLSKPRAVQNTAASPGKENVHDDFNDEGFSDDIDMSELDHLLLQKTSQLPAFNSIKSVPDTKGESLKLEVIEEHIEGFSSDDDMMDDELDDMIIKLTQKPANNLPNTQALLRSDKTNAALFQQELKRADSISTRKTKEGTTNKAKSAIKKKNFHRFEIVEVVEGKYTKNSRSYNEKSLKVLSALGDTHEVIVRDLWETLDFSPGDVIHVIGVNPWIVDSQNNMLVWNPDYMLSATAVGEALVCERKAVLNAKLTFPGESSVPLIVGNIVHSIIQECLAKENSTLEFVSELIENQLQANLISILSINESKESIKGEVVKHVPYIQTWMKQFISQRPSFAIPSQNSRTKSMVSVSNVLDVEEYIWSPMYGIRGLIDVTIEATVKDSNFDGRYVTPLEIKTGARESLLHRAQTSLYTLLINDRYDLDSKFFLLLYSKLKEMKKHEINIVDLKLLINIRNRISLFLRENRRDLPPLLRQSKCDGCFALEACMTMNNLTEDGTALQSGLKEGLYEQITKEIDGNENYKKFFNYWDDLITKEESVINALKKELWTKSSSVREAVGGKAIGNLKITESVEESSGFVYTLERAVSTVNDPSSLQNSQLSKNDRVIISDEDGHFALSSGWVVAVRPSFITIRTDRQIINSFLKLPGFNATNNQRFRSVLHKAENVEELVENQSKTRRYRVDKDEMFQGLALARYNLLNLFLPQVGDSLRRKILVDSQPPRFTERPLPYSISPKQNFNSDQVNAFEKVLKARDFSLILGMPGTGKTTVIAQIIRFIIANNMSVLLASYTHSAVDNILLKLLDDELPILRAGYPSRVHPQVRKYVPNSGVEGSITIKDSSDFRKAYIDAQIVATTCLGINDVVFNHRNNFDYCIIDEASQVSMPVCLGPLRFCNKFILVGDHYQLPPLIISPEAKLGGLDKSLFMTLSDKFPEAVVDLSYQYRMCADIMLLSNTLIYEGRLKCGSDQVSTQKLHVPFPEKLNSFLKDPNCDRARQWITPILDPNNKVLFLNHDEMPAFERVVGDKVENETEAELVRQVVQSLIFCGVDEKSIGVMSLYRAQLRLLYRKLTVCKEVEILTADQFQGRDKDCVIISMVRSNDYNSVGDLLKEWRRINVAITRARSKLIILGSRRTMRNLKTLEAFMSIIEVRGWMYNLPKNADLFYNVFLEGDTRTQSPKRIRHTISSKSKIVQNRPITKNILDELIG